MFWELFFFFVKYVTLKQRKWSCIVWLRHSLVMRLTECVFCDHNLLSIPDEQIICISKYIIFMLSKTVVWNWYDWMRCNANECTHNSYVIGIFLSESINSDSKNTSFYSLNMWLLYKLVENAQTHSQAWDNWPGLCQPPLSKMKHSHSSYISYIHLS